MVTPPDLPYIYIYIYICIIYICVCVFTSFLGETKRVFQISVHVTMHEGVLV